MATTWDGLGTTAATAALAGAVESAAGLFEAAACSVALLPPVGAENQTWDGLRFVAAHGAGEREIVGTVVGPGRGIASFVAASGTALVVDDVRGDPRFARDVAESSGYVPRTILAAPAVRGGEVVGVLEVLDPTRRTRDLELLESWATVLGVVAAVATPARGPLVGLAEEIEQRHPGALDLATAILESVVRDRTTRRR